jgi:DNA gyrase subunit B
MYVGSTSTRGLHNMVFEVAEWAVDEVLAGRAGRVDVTLTADGAVEVAHDGPGVPFEDGEEPGMESRLTLMWVGTASSGRRGALVGRFGLGLFVPNALSSRLTAEVRRDGTRWVQEYTRGVASGPPSAAGQAEGSGTSLTFWPDAEIFAVVQCSFDDLAGRLRELALVNHGLDITLTDQRPHPPRMERLCFPGGTKDFVALLDRQVGTPVHRDVIGFELEDRRMAGTMEVALRWHVTPEERFVSFANCRPTPQGGAHVVGFRDGVAAAFTGYARREGLLPPTAPGVAPGQIGSGLTAVVSVKLDAPEFEGATRGILGNAAVRSCVAEAVRDHLTAWLEHHPDVAAALAHRVLY